MWVSQAMRRKILQAICVCIVASSVFLQGVANTAMAGCHESLPGNPVQNQQVHEHVVSAGEQATVGHLNTHSDDETYKAQKDKAGDCCDCHGTCKASFMLPSLGNRAVEVNFVVTSTPTLPHQNSDLIPPYRPPISG